jgi:hypothetical protein
LDEFSNRKPRKMQIHGLVVAGVKGNQNIAPGQGGRERQAKGPHFHSDQQFADALVFSTF